MVWFKFVYTECYLNLFALTCSPPNPNIVYLRCVARFDIICRILKNVKNTHGAVLLLVKLKAHICFMGVFLHGSFFVFYSLKTWKKKHSGVKLQAQAWNCAKSNSSPWVFFTFFNCTNGTKSRNTTHLLGWESRFEIPQILKNVGPFISLTKNSHFTIRSTHFWPILLFYIP